MTTALVQLRQSEATTTTVTWMKERRDTAGAMSSKCHSNSAMLIPVKESALLCLLRHHSPAEHGGQMWTQAQAIQDSGQFKGIKCCCVNVMRLFRKTKC